jgi:hypothetical protein
VRARNVKHTTRFICGLPLAIFVIYYFGISDAFIGWLFCNYIVLLPAWPAVKSAFFVPKPIRKTLETAQRVLVPRFLRAPSTLEDDDAKLKTD